MTSVGVVVLTMGSRPDELRRAWNRCSPKKALNSTSSVWAMGGSPSICRQVFARCSFRKPRGLWRTQCRVRGRARRHSVLLRRRCWLTDPQFVRRAVAAFDAWPELGILQPRVHDPLSDADATRWIPRVRKGDPHESSAAFSVGRAPCWCDAAPLTRQAVSATNSSTTTRASSWRGDAGTAETLPGTPNLEAHHPAAAPTRHDMFYRMHGRNRVWVARRNLPTPLIPLYVGTWTAFTRNQVARRQSRTSPWFDGWKEGRREDQVLDDPSVGEPSGGWRCGRPPVI